MLEPAVVVLRLLQYGGAMVLLGSSLFFLYALPRAGAASAAQMPWARRLLLAGALLLGVSAVLGLLAQTSVMAGSIGEGLKRESLQAVISGMDLGRAAVVRSLAAIAAAGLLLILRPGRGAWAATAGLGALATASFAWMGHAAATEGGGKVLHLGADIAHAWAAAVWVGALVAFFLLLRVRSPSLEAAGALHRALHGFSGIGTLLVAVLLATGVVNSWFLVGPDRLEGLWTTPYGRLLCLKIAAFVGMLALAAANRFRHTPALAASLESSERQPQALAALRRSVALETGLGVAVLALVAWFGTMAPPSAL